MASNKTIYSYIWVYILYFRCQELYLGCLDLYFGCLDLYLGVWTMSTMWSVMDLLFCPAVWNTVSRWVSGLVLLSVIGLVGLWLWRVALGDPLCAGDIIARGPATRGPYWPGDPWPGWPGPWDPGPGPGPGVTRAREVRNHKACAWQGQQAESVKLWTKNSTYRNLANEGFQ